MSLYDATKNAVWLDRANTLAGDIERQFLHDDGRLATSPNERALLISYSFWAARGTMALTKVTEGRVKLEFDFDGLIPYGLYTLWNVLETEPFKDEPLGPFGYAQHSVVADGSGRAHKVVILDQWPGKEFLLDYLADGKLSQSKGVYPGALWGLFPPEPKM